MTEVTGEMPPLAVVTGASRGIGRKLFEDLAGDYTVVGTSTSVEGARGLVDFLDDNDLPGTGSELDLSNPENIEPWYTWVKEAYGRPSVIINNAGVTMDNLYLLQTPDVSDTVMAVNFRSPWEMLRAAGRDLKRTGGVIVNMSSVASVIPNKAQGLYGASKAALNHMTINTPVETKESVRAVALALGPVNTAMWEHVPEDFKEAILAGTDSGEPLSLESVVGAVRKIIESDVSGVVVHHNDGLWTPHEGDPHHITLDQL